MKTKSFLFVAFFLLIGSFTLLNAQSDLIFKTDGNEMMGKVVEMDSTEIKFILNNETEEHTIPRDEIVKITLASGETEFMDSAHSSTESTTNSNKQLSKNLNTVAILPFAYFKDRVEGSKNMAYKVQAKVYSIYNKQKTNFQFQDPKVTNALLSKSGVKSVDGHAMDEICEILNVEYVVQGTVAIEQAGQSSNSNTTKKRKFETESSKKAGLITDSKETGSANTRASANYSTFITMKIYNDIGENTFNQERSSNNSNANSYTSMLKSLAKKTPIYSK
ncbi:MAG: hypothetical protein ACTIJ9_06545 [Aequorivita sp.]